MKTFQNSVKLETGNATQMNAIVALVKSYLARKSEVVIERIEICGTTVQVVYRGLKSLALDIMGYVKNHLESRYQSRLSVSGQ